MSSSTGKGRKETHPIPDAEVSGKNLRDMKIISVDSYGVAEWCPLPDGQGKPEAVIVHFEAGDYTFMIRLKSAGEVDRLIGMLARHKFGVWPDAGGVQ